MHIVCPYVQKSLMRPDTCVLAGMQLKSLEPMAGVNFT